MSLRFMLREQSKRRVIKNESCVIWQVILLTKNNEPSQLIAEFIGGRSNKFLDPEIAQAVAGDYVEFLNEKYLDKNINEEWPPKDPELYYKYHLERVKHYEKLMEEEFYRRGAGKI